MRARCLHLVPALPKYIDMNKSTRLLITAAAIAGLYTGALASRTYAQTEKAGTEDKAKADKGKHDCKGKNGCAGEGGCKTGDNGCKGKNSCKGKGGCKTAMAEAKGDKNSCKSKDGCNAKDPKKSD
jgi:hypothetical protein